MPDKLLLIRPEKQSRALAEELKKIGIESLCDPIMTITPVLQKPPEWTQYSGLIVTSANAIPALKNIPPPLPVYTVGPATTKAVKEETPCQNVINANGSAQDLITHITAQKHNDTKPLLYLSGETITTPLHEELNSQNIPCERQIAYKAEAMQTLSRETINALKNSEIQAIPFYSARTAAIFQNMVKKENLRNTLNTIKALCLSKAVLKSLHASDWEKTYSCEEPNTASMMRLIKSVCL